MPAAPDGLAEGVLYFLDMKLTEGKTQWTSRLPWGMFPPAAPDESVADPIFPYGVYEHCDVNDDPEIRGMYMGGLMYLLRKLKMNALVFGSRPQQYLVDLAAKYHVQADRRPRDRPRRRPAAGRDRQL